MTYRLFDSREAIYDLVNQHRLPSTITIRIAQTSDFRAPATMDDIGFELFTPAPLPGGGTPQMPDDVATFIERAWLVLQRDLKALMEPYAPFYGIRLWIRRDETGYVSVDGSEGRAT